ncbi:hypothetical protein CLM65_14220 [Serratia marcescens]|uniref:TA system antitoxin ParD family protein n=1 Tax=Serratia marcescens TaxID=615 RepID=UPI0004507714|nr:hypothetical protein [Serratia marcescens]AWC76430.1 hypothetical protein AM371_16515 [Serratia marcescens]EZQ73124.1 hypothetical protein AF53_00371 [Serratia marcescens BIDMC 80]RLO30380.1 hypothetical protein CLM65_14220 [Serratia marcescens]
MAISIRLDEDFVSDAKVYAEASSRSIPKQIEHWARIGRIAEENPDLPFSFISEALIAHSEYQNHKAIHYERRTKRNRG